MSLPSIAAYPPAQFRVQVSVAEWDAALDAWIAVTAAYLRESDSNFSSHNTDESSYKAFLLSYFSELSVNKTSLQTEKDQRLKRNSFLLAHRILSRQSPPTALLDWQFLGHLSNAFLRSSALSTLLNALWKRQRTQIEQSIEKLRIQLISRLEKAAKRNSDGESELVRDLSSLTALCYVLSEVGHVVVAGSDLLDAATTGYAKYNHHLRDAVLAFTYVALTSLLSGAKPNLSLLSDHIYALKGIADANKDKQTSSLLSDLVSKTSLLSKLQSISNTDSTRITKLLPVLTSYQQPGYSRPKKTTRPKPDKGKATATNDHSGGVVHVHRLSLITQIQELFPDLGAGFIIKLLDEYDDNTETVTLHLLEDSLPPHLKSADRHESLSLPPHSPRLPSTPPPPDHTPHTTTLPTRHNIHDRSPLPLAAYTHHSHSITTADTLLSTAPTTSAKAAILSALATFDADDDEHDDTYDATDIGGAIDTAQVAGSGDNDVAISAAASASLQDETELKLYGKWKVAPGVFARDAATRRSVERRKLREETGWTDEAVEGWALMLQREPGRVRRLEARLAMSEQNAGRQNMLNRTRYRAGDEETASDSDVPGPSGAPPYTNRGRGSGRGGGGFRGGRGGPGRGGNAAAGPSGDQATQNARKKNEANKGSRANHNRRQQRARKVARAGFPR